MTAPRNAFDPEEILAGILRWVRIESPTYDLAAVNRMMDTAAADMRDLGAAVERIAGVDGYGDCVRATVSGQREGPGVLVLGHIDTVHPVGTIDGRLPVRRDGEKVYGPGIFDMKGGMYLAVHALKETLRQRGRPALPVTFLFISDEEVGSPSTRAMIEGEARRHRFVLVPEPSRGGTAVTGRHAFQRFWVTVHGRPAHAGATPRQGSSAISAMAPSTALPPIPSPAWVPTNTPRVPLTIGSKIPNAISRAACLPTSLNRAAAIMPMSSMKMTSAPRNRSPNSGRT